MLGLPGYTLNRKIYESAASLVYRGVHQADNAPVVLKVLRQAYPSLEDINRYRQEYEILRSLSVPGVIRALEQIPYRHTYVIAFEDIGGEALSNWMQQWPHLYSPMPIPDFLKLAIALVETLGQLHQNQIIHRDINPSNIVLNPSTGQVKLIDFGLATPMSRTESSPVPPRHLEGTLAYLSPEQTGRMNRMVDYRTDFYSLGVTFYELLTGCLPFSKDDLLELVHCHLAQEPSPPATVSPNLPPGLSDIVMKLMAKDADDRYQSASGLRVDLEQCLTLLQTQGTIPPFPLATQDFTGQLHIPQKLYGRDREIGQVLAAFERVAGRVGTETVTEAIEGSQDSETSRWTEKTQPHPPSLPLHPFTSSPFTPSLPPPSSELLLITGYSGIGKSSLVRELYRPITERRGYFVSGKFEQYQRGVPYTAVVDAFAELVRQILGEGETELQRWHDRILTAVGSNGQVIIDVLPDVEHIIGAQPTIPTLGLIETQNRFNYVFQAFIRACCSPEHPLTLFLDDLQWADSASLNLLQLVLTDEQIHHLLVVGAYRNNEVHSAHPLAMTLKKLAEARVRTQTLTLTPLDRSDLEQLLSDTLHQPVDAIAALTELVMQKTTGNPFFVTQFLKTLCSQALLTFHPNQHCWQWDIAQIQAANFTDNVVALMAADIQQLPPSTQQVLQLAACIGAEFELAELEMLTERSPSTVLSDLSMAIAAGLLIASGGHDSYGQPNRYRFVHDQIQQTAYELIRHELRQRVHLRLGRWLWQQSPNPESPDNLFEIVDHLNLGLLCQWVESSASHEERQQIAHLNLKAGIKAKRSMAYHAATEYLEVGLRLLQPSAWETSNGLTLALHEEAAEAAYLSGNLRQMNAYIDTILTHAITPLDRVRSYDIHIQALVTQSKLQEAIAAGLAILHDLGIDLPPNPTAAESQVALKQLNILLADWSNQDLLALPEMSNPVSLASVQVLARIAAASYISDPRLLPFVLLKIFELSLQFGNTPGSTIGYLGYALMLCGYFGEIERGYQFGQLADALVAQFDAHPFQSKVCNVLGGHILFWKEPLRSSIPTLLMGYESGIETGDFEYAGYNLRNVIVNTYFSGTPLPDVLETAQTRTRAIQQLRQDVAFNWSSVYWQAVLNLVNPPENPIQLVGQAYDETQRIPIAHHQGNQTELYTVYLNKLMLAYLLGEFDLAVENSTLASHYAGAVAGMIDNAVYCFYDALTQLALASPDLDRVHANQEKLRLWATHAPMNFLHKVYLIDAEKTRVLGHVLEAEENYEQAIAGAKANGYLQDLALAYELAARFYRQRGRDLIANTYLKEAHYAYSLWGATVKVNQLESQFPDLLPPQTGQQTHAERVTTHTSLNSARTSPQHIDLQAVFRATRAIASAIELPRLQSTLLKILLESTGAQRGYLLLPAETADGQPEWRIGAVGHSETSNRHNEIAVDVLLQQPMMGHVPITLVNYVLRTQKSVLLDDATQMNDFSADAYLRNHPTRSILCAPILNQGMPIGLVYLENTLTVGAFTPDRLELVQLLAGQAAISLRNARLYGQLQASEAQVRQSEQRVKQFLDAIPVGISVFDPTGHLAYQNPKAQNLQGVHVSDGLTIDDLTDAFQVYQADTNQPYPTEEWPVVRALNGETIRIDDMELRRDDKVLPLEVSATPILNEQGEIVYAIAAFTDITERKQAQKLLTDYNRTLEAEVQERTEALTNQWNLLQTLIDHIPVMLAFYDTDGKIILVNRAVEEITGWSITELNQTTWLKQVYPDPSYRWQALEHWEAADGTWLDRTLRCRDGGSIETTWAHIRLKDGRTIGIGQDITHRKRMEESLRLQAEEERLLATITQHIRQSLNLTDILTTTVAELQRNFQVDRALILKFCDDGIIRVIQSVASTEHQIPDTLEWLPDCTLKDCYELCLAGHPRISFATDSSACLASVMKSLGVQSEITAPIIYPASNLDPSDDGRIWGLLMVQACRTPRQWQASEADFLQQISDQLAIGIYQSDLYHQLQVELTERRQAEVALRQSEARLTAAQAIAHMGNWELDAKTGAMIWSEQLFHIAGLSPQYAAPTFTELMDICHPDDGSIVEQNVKNALKTGEPYQIIFRVRRPDNTLRYVESRAEADCDTTGQVVRLMGIAQDISDRYEIDRLKDEFIGIVSHELRTPLTAIQSSLTILTSGLFADNPDQAARMIQIASNNCDRLVRLVNDILDLERLESGKAELNITPCPITDLMQQSVEALHPLANDAQIHLVWKPHDAVLLVDPDAIIQTLTNLLSNAIKFSEPGSTVILAAQKQTTDSLNGNTDKSPFTPSPLHSLTPPLPHPSTSSTPSPLHLSTPSLPHPSLLLSITDHGRGIPHDKLESIFDRFQQVDAVDSRQKGGTGLGLAICKTIVQRHGGTIWVESVLGEGSTFYFTLPLRVGEDMR